METADLQLEHFTNLVGEKFVGDFGADGSLDLTLTEAVPVATGATDQASFSLIFRGPADRVFQQGLVPLEHQAIGDHSLMLVAIGEDADGRDYEAVFTRLIR